MKAEVKDWPPRLDPLPNPSKLRLRNGTEVVIRGICPDDEQAMARFHSTLSDRSVYFRYFCSITLAARTAHQRLVRICFADPASETVLVAIHTKPQSRDEILAVGRLNKLHPKNEAEVAILVSDEYQGLGLGNELLRQLIQVGRNQELDRIVAEMLRDNIAMQALLKKAGFRLRLFGDPQFVRAVLEL